MLVIPGDCWPNSANFGPNLVDFGQFGQVCSTFDQLWMIAGQFRSNSGHSSSDLADFVQHLIDFGSTRVDYGSFLCEIGRVRATFDRSWPNLVEVDRFRPNIGRTRPKFVRILAHVARIRQHSTGVGPRSAKKVGTSQFVWQPPPLDFGLGCLIPHVDTQHTPTGTLVCGCVASMCLVRVCVLLVCHPHARGVDLQEAYQRLTGTCQELSETPKHPESTETRGPKPSIPRRSRHSQVDSPRTCQRLTGDFAGTSRDLLETYRGL